MKFVSRHTAAAVVASMLPILASAGPGGDSDDFTQLSLQQLMQVKVTSVSRKQQKLAHAAAAIYVLTQEEINRSTATTIPELLRTIPGLQVARLDTGKWVVTARGFASEYANKLLVLIDGRTIYDPYFAGVRWDAQDTMLDDIDRIEVIRGPGAPMWGSDAVNGVINIITKQARDTQGGLAAATTGSTDNALGNVRYGVKLGRNTYLRASSRYANRDALGGETASTGWQTLRGRFRLDSDLSSRDALTVTGDWYGVRSGQQSTVPVMEPPFVRTYANDARSDGRSVLGRWTHTVSEDSNLSVQFYL